MKITANEKRAIREVLNKITRITKKLETYKKHNKLTSIEHARNEYWTGKTIGVYDILRILDITIDN